MKIQLKIALMVAFVALLSSCQKEEMPMPGVYPGQDQGAANQRITIQTSGDDHTPVGNALGGDGQPVADSSGIVGGGDDDRDGGIVGGGDDDKDGGSKKGEAKKP